MKFSKFDHFCSQNLYGKQCLKTASASDPPPPGLRPWTPLDPWAIISQVKTPITTIVPNRVGKEIHQYIQGGPKTRLFLEVCNSVYYVDIE